MRPYLAGEAVDDVGMTVNRAWTCDGKKGWVGRSGAANGRGATSHRAKEVALVAARDHEEGHCSANSADAGS